MGNSDDLPANVVVESVYAVCVDETVPDPNTSLYNVFYLSNNLQTKQFWGLHTHSFKAPVKKSEMNFN